MSQHDMVIANAGFPATRADINSALVALASLSSGTSAPSSPTTHQLWLDTTATPYLLKYYDGTDWIVLLRINATTNKPDSQTLITPLGLVSGFAMGNNAGDANSDIDIAAGAAVDSAGAYLMQGAAMTKQLDATWAAGSNAGGNFTGSSKGNNTTYYRFAIRKDSDGSIDYGFDTSKTAANKPVGYSNYRRLPGIVRTDGSGNIRGFLQRGFHFFWKAPIQDLATTAATEDAWTSLTLSVPLVEGVMAFGTAQLGNGSGGKCPTFFQLRSPDASDATPAEEDGSTLGGYVTGSSDKWKGTWGPIAVNTSGQIQYYGQSTGSDFAAYIRTRGYVDDALNA